MAFNPHIGRIGIWSAGFRWAEQERRQELADAAAELDELGYGTLWIGGSPAFDAIEAVLGATSRLTVGTSILTIWQYQAAEVAARHAALSAAHGDRFVLGLGVSHAETVGEDHAQRALRDRPYSAMRSFLDDLDAAPQPVPPHQRALAALGPKMLRLARDRALGALPYLVTAEHTAEARETLGPDALLAPELKVVLDDDLARARATARAYLGKYLLLANYRNSLLRLGFTEDDFADDGSDRLLDSVYALGDAEAVRSRVDDFLAAGADHVAVQVVTEDPLHDLPRAQWRTLAEALPLAGPSGQGAPGEGRGA